MLHRNSAIGSGLLALGHCALPALALALSSGPGDGRTGAPGETNCTACHSSFPLDSGAGGFQTGSFETFYVPGDSYTLVLEIDDPDASRWGFEITFIDAAGAKAGELGPLDGDTQTSESVFGGQLRQYGKQTSAGSFPGTPGSAIWSMSWSAPPTGTGPITLYGMGNAANGNGSNSGDRIYSLVLPLEEATSTGAGEEAPLLARLAPNYPNPFNPRTTLAFDLDAPATMRLSIYDARGRLIRVLHEGPLAGGRHERVWDGRDGAGRESPAGVYFARIQGADGRNLDAARRMTLLK